MLRNPTTLTVAGLGIAACAAVCLLFASPAGAGASAGVPRLEVHAPADPVIADWPFEVSSSWNTDVPSGLHVLLIQARSCGESAEEGMARDPRGIVVVDGEKVTDAGSRADELTITTVGEYLVCGYLQRGGATDAVVVSPPRVLIMTGSGGDDAQGTGRRGTRCRRVGGPRRISRVRAYRVGCRTARGVARRWGRGDPAPRVVFAYMCRRRARLVTCRAYERKIVFRVRPA